MVYHKLCFAATGASFAAMSLIRNATVCSSSTCELNVYLAMKFTKKKLQLPFAWMFAEVLSFNVNYFRWDDRYNNFASFSIHHHAYSAQKVDYHTFCQRLITSDIVHLLINLYLHEDKLQHDYYISTFVAYFSIKPSPKITTNGRFSSILIILFNMTGFWFILLVELHLAAF